MKHFRKVLAVLLSVAMLVGLTLSMNVTAAQNETIIIAGSDYQTHDGTAHIELITNAMKADGINPDKLLFGGDYSLEHSHATSTAGVAELKNFFKTELSLDDNDMTFAQGNHDPDTTVDVSWGNQDPAYGEYGLYIVEDPALAQEWGSYDAASVAALQLYLDKKVEIGFNKPIFIMNHFPLHWSYRTQKDGVSTNAFRFFNVINEAAGKGLNIIYLFGHNHSNGYDDSMGGPCIFLKKGDTIQICQGSKKEYKEETLNFTYMNSGYTGYYTSPMENAETTLSMSVFRIRGNEVYVTRYSKDGVYNLKSAGVENTSFTYEYMPAVNTTVYAGTYKIAVDGSAASVDTLYESADTGLISNGETSTSEDVKGLAFKFDVTASDVAYTMEKNSYVVDYTNATINGYKLVGMGAIVTNKTTIGTDGSSFYKGAVDGKQVVDIPCKYLWGLGEASASFAVRITNIPDTAVDKAVYARPYYIYENENGTQITVYGDIVGASYNGKLTENDGELEW